MHRIKLRKSILIMLAPLVWLAADYLVHEKIKLLMMPELNEAIARRTFGIGLGAGLVIATSLACAVLIGLAERRKKQSDDYVDQMSRKFFVPINALIGLSTSMVQTNCTSPHLNKEAELIQNTSRRIKRMLIDIEDYNKLCYGKLTINRQSLNLRTIADTALSYIQSNYPVEGVSIVNNIEQNCYVYADPIRLQQIIGNIMVALLNFTAKGTITLSTIRHKLYHEVVIFDDGIGIEQSFKAVVFEPISGANAVSTGHYGGTGLSLAVTKELVQLHRGRIWINKQLSDCTEFHFTLLKDSMVPHFGYKPYKDTYCVRDIGDRSMALLHETGRELGNILLVKDRSIHKSMMAFCLYEAGYNVHYPRDIMSALRRTDIDKRYDLVILDDIFSFSNFDLCCMLRKSYSIAQLPIIIVVLNDRQINLSKAFAIGANDCIDHLFLQEQLLAKAQSLILMKRASDEALDRQISLLQAQIQPHFLYNALNVITQLCLEDPQKAHDVLLDFSQYLRGKFGFATLNRPISINQEILTIRSYLNVEKARFGNRLDFEIVVTGSGERTIPSLIIQPLVENSVKHGIGGSATGGRVNVTVVEDADGTTVQVTDNGSGMSRSTLNAIVAEDNSKLGTGLINVNKRLKLYSSDGLHVESTIGKGTTIHYKIPLDWELDGKE